MKDYSESYFDLTKYTKQFYEQALKNDWEAAFKQVSNIVEQAEILAKETRDKYVEQVRKETL